MWACIRGEAQPEATRAHTPEGQRRRCFNPEQVKEFPQTFLHVVCLRWRRKRGVWRVSAAFSISNKRTCERRPWTKTTDLNACISPSVTQKRWASVLCLLVNHPPSSILPQHGRHCILATNKPPPCFSPKSRKFLHFVVHKVVFLGRARRSRDGLTVSCRCCWCAGPHPRPRSP